MDAWQGRINLHRLPRFRGSDGEHLFRRGESEFDGGGRFLWEGNGAFQLENFHDINGGLTLPFCLHSVFFVCYSLCKLIATCLIGIASNLYPRFPLCHLKYSCELCFGSFLASHFIAPNGTSKGRSVHSCRFQPRLDTRSSQFWPSIYRWYNINMHFLCLTYVFDTREWAKKGGIVSTFHLVSSNRSSSKSSCLWNVVLMDIKIWFFLVSPASLTFKFEGAVFQLCYWFSTVTGISEGRASCSPSGQFISMIDLSN